MHAHEPMLHEGELDDVTFELALEGAPSEDG
jgi:hypothetical protein